MGFVNGFVHGIRLRRAVAGSEAAGRRSRLRRPEASQRHGLPSWQFTAGARQESGQSYANTAARVCTSSSRSARWTRSASVSIVSPGITGTSAWDTTFPVS